MAELEAEEDAAALEGVLGPLADRLLTLKGVPEIDDGSRLMLMREIARALREGFQAAQHKAEGDYSEDAAAARYPAWSEVRQPEPSQTVSLKGLVDGWWKEAKARDLSDSTYDSYQRAM